jgi:hypothetical protein
MTTSTDISRRFWNLPQKAASGWKMDVQKVSDIMQELEEYIDGWIQDSIRYVDSIQ